MPPFLLICCSWCMTESSQGSSRKLKVSVNIHQYSPSQALWSLPQDLSHPLFRVKNQLFIDNWQAVLWSCNASIRLEAGSMNEKTEPSLASQTTSINSFCFSSFFVLCITQLVTLLIHSSDGRVPLLQALSVAFQVETSYSHFPSRVGND